MRKIERPESTTYLFEQSFHLIKDQEEADRIRKVIATSDPQPKIIPVMRMVDPETYEPMMAFAIYYEGDMFAECLKYVAPKNMCPVDFATPLPIHGSKKIINPQEIKVI